MAHTFLCMGPPIWQWHLCTAPCMWGQPRVLYMQGCLKPAYKLHINTAFAAHMHVHLGGTIPLIRTWRLCFYAKSAEFVGFASNKIQPLKHKTKHETWLTSDGSRPDFLPHCKTPVSLRCFCFFFKHKTQMLQA